tara:strand:+ start:5082 stop:6170 length:1089 start_codon:yes stop_codon:yes gene_type:complete
MKRSTVVHIILGTGATAMAWNDLYGTIRKQYPGLQYLPIFIKKNFSSSEIKYAKCQNVLRKYIAVNPIGFIFFIFYLKKSKKFKKVIFHFHHPTLMFFLPIIKIMSDKFILFANLHNDFRFFKFYQKFFYSLGNLFTDLNITVSYSILKSLPIKNKRKYKSILNGINKNYFDLNYPVNIIKNNFRNNNLIIIARLVPQKNIALAIKIFSKLKYVDYLVIYGDGELLNFLKQQAIYLNISKRVLFKGIVERNEIYKVLSESSGYLSTSKWEGIGVANIEAAALGCMPFISDIQPHNEICEAIGLDSIDLNKTNDWIFKIDNWFKRKNSEKEITIEKIIKTTRNKFDSEKLAALYAKEYRNFFY